MYEHQQAVPHFPMANPPRSRARSYTAPSALQPPTFAAFVNRTVAPDPTAIAPMPAVKAEDETPTAAVNDGSHKLQCFLSELNAAASTRECRPIAIRRVLICRSYSRFQSDTYQMGQSSHRVLTHRRCIQVNVTRSRFSHCIYTRRCVFWS